MLDMSSFALALCFFLINIGAPYSICYTSTFQHVQLVFMAKIVLLHVVTVPVVNRVIMLMESVPQDVNQDGL